MKTTLVLACILSVAFANQIPVEKDNDSPVAPEVEAPKTGDRSAKQLVLPYAYIPQNHASLSNIHPGYAPLAYSYYQNPYYVPQNFRFAAPNPYAAPAAYAYAQHPQYLQNFAPATFLQPSSSDYLSATVQDTPALSNDYAVNSAGLDSVAQEHLGAPTPAQRFFFWTQSSSVSVSGTTTSTVFSTCKQTLFGQLCFGR